MKPATTFEIQYEVNGLESLREIRDSTVQAKPHSHNEIEVLLLERGTGTWLMGGEIATFKPGQLVMYWAIKPHQLIKSSRKMVINWLTIPLTVFIEWRLPEKFSKSVLAGNVMVEPDRSWFAFDKRSFLNWHSDLKSSDQNRQKLALQEIECRLGRLALHLEGSLPQEALKTASPGLLSYSYFTKISQIADFVSRHFAEPITVPDIAKAIDMNPTSATKLFKKICGMNLMHYLTQHRIFHAQRLLASSDMKILDVALESGYQSASRFYAAFKEFCGVSPQEFRKSFDLRKIPLEQKAGVWKVGKARPSSEMLHTLQKM